MPLFLCDAVSGPVDDEPNVIRPAIAEYAGAWSCVCDGRTGSMLVRADHQAAFDSDARIRPMRRAMLANLAPDDGETDDWDADDLAIKIARRFLLRQRLGALDFGTNLDATIGDIPAARRQAIRNRLLLSNIEIGGLNAGTSIADAMRFILPQFKVRLRPGKISPSGTFTDNFDGEGSTIDLASHTPSGGTAWTRVDGSSGMGQCTSGGNMRGNTSDTNGALYQCDDQGSADQYHQYRVQTTNAGPLVCNRADSRADYVGTRPRSASSAVQLFVRNAGTLTGIGSSSGAPSTNDIIRLESSGDAQEVFLNAVSVISGVNESHNNTVTRQGFNARLNTAHDFDDFEAGVLGGGATFQPAWARGSNSIIMGGIG